MLKNRFGYEENILFSLFFSALFSLKSIAAVPEGAIPFVFDGHLYLQSTLNDTIPVTLIYDTGADFLYLDEDYLKLKICKTLSDEKVRLKWEVRGMASLNA